MFYVLRSVVTYALRSKTELVLGFQITGTLVPFGILAESGRNVTELVLGFQITGTLVPFGIPAESNRNVQPSTPAAIRGTRGGQPPFAIQQAHSTTRATGASSWQHARRGPRAGEEGEGDVVVDFTTRRSVTDGGGGAECTEKKEKKARNNYV